MTSSPKRLATQPVLTGLLGGGAPCRQLLSRVLLLPPAPWGKGSGLAQGLTRSWEEASDGNP